MTRDILTVNLELKGAAQVKALLKGVAPKVVRKIERRSMKEAIEPLVTSVKSQTPVRTGALLSTVKRKISANNKRVLGQIISGGEKAWYAHLIEYGWWFTSHAGKRLKYIPGKKFMRGPVQTHAQGIVDSLMAGVIEALQEVHD